MRELGHLNNHSFGSNSITVVENMTKVREKDEIASMAVATVSEDSDQLSNEIRGSVDSWFGEIIRSGTHLSFALRSEFGPAHTLSTDICAVRRRISRPTFGHIA
jgi:hypothetical protein